MFDILLNVRIPFNVGNVAGKTKEEAVENIKNLLTDGFELVVAENIQKIQKEMVFEIVNVEEK